MSLHLKFKSHPITHQNPFLIFSDFPEKQQKAYSKITKGGHSESRDSTEKYVSNGECTVLDSAILSLSLSL